MGFEYLLKRATTVVITMLIASLVFFINIVITNLPAMLEGY